MSTLLTDWRHRFTHKNVWALAAPMILSNLSVPLVTLVDSAVIGHLPHAHQLGAVAVGGSLFTFMVSLMSFLRMGTTGFAAQAAGRRDGDALRQILVPVPKTAPVGGKPLRDQDILDWASQLIHAVLLDDIAAASAT